MSPHRLWLDIFTENLYSVFLAYRNKTEWTPNLAPTQEVQLHHKSRGSTLNNVQLSLVLNYSVQDHNQSSLQPTTLMIQSLVNKVWLISANKFHCPKVLTSLNFSHPRGSLIYYPYRYYDHVCNTCLYPMPVFSVSKQEVFLKSGASSPISE